MTTYVNLLIIVNSQNPTSPGDLHVRQNVLIYACKALVISSLQAKAILLLSLLFRIINKRLNRKNSFDISLPSLDDDDVCIIGYRYNATEVKIVLE